MNTTRGNLLKGGERLLKRVGRRCTSDRLQGFVLDVGDTWVLMAVLADNISLNGFSVFRLADVTTVEDRAEMSSFVSQTLVDQKTWPPSRPSRPVRLGDTRAMISDASLVSSVVLIYTEDVDEDVCFVGIPVGFTDRSVGLREISYTGTWTEDSSEWYFDEITRLDFGDLYTSRLLAVASKAQ